MTLCLKGHLVIFTDLDGTLLDLQTYSFEKALPGIELLEKHDIPLIICSSKTRQEIEFYRRKLGNEHPFISENGGGIFIPNQYFDLNARTAALTVEIENDYQLIRLGAKYSELRKAVEVLRAKGFFITGFGDMSNEEVSEATGLTLAEAEMAKQRDFDEPFFFEGDSAALFSTIASLGFHYTKGEIFHILGNSSKGKAVSILSSLYEKKLGGITTVALGDSPNDIPMLEKADFPVAVQKPDGTYDPAMNIPNLIKAEGVGPEGWTWAIRSLIASLQE